MVHPNTLFAEFTRRWSCAITIQASTAVEIVFKWTASCVLPLKPFLQSFPFSVSLKPETSSGRALEFQSMVSLGIKEKNGKLRKCLARDWLWSRTPLSITGFTVLACTVRISRNREINSSGWVFLNKLSNKTLVDLRKRFPHVPCVSMYLAANFSRGLAILLGHEEETWNMCPLRTDSTSLKGFSTNFLIENSSSRNSCSLFISSNFWILEIRVSRSARSPTASSSWSRACSRLDCSYFVRICPNSTAWESICPLNSQILFSARSALYSCLRISDFVSASNCTLVFPNLILIWQLSNCWLDLRFCDIQLTGLTVLAKIDCAP